MLAMVRGFFQRKYIDVAVETDDIRSYSLGVPVSS